MLLAKRGHNPLTHRLAGHIPTDMTSAGTIAEFFPEVTAEEVQQALKSMKHYNNLLVAPGHLKRGFIYALLAMTGNYKEMHGLIVNYKPNPKCADSNIRLSQLYHDAISLAVRLICEYRENGAADSEYQHTFEWNRSRKMGKEKMTKLEKQWVLYDVGNSAFVMLVSTIIPIYFKNMATASGISAANSTAYLSYAISISTILVALLGPVCGAAADNKGFKKPLFTAFMMIGVIACAAMGIPKTWLAFLVVFVIAKVGFSGSLIFYDSMLVDVTTDERMDEVSSHGYAWGYIGSCIPFVGSLILVLMSDRIGISAAMAMMLAFGITAIWWVAVTIPLLLNYKQNYYAETKVSVKETVVRLGNIFSELKANKKVLLFLISFFFLHRRCVYHYRNVHRIWQRCGNR